MVTKEKETYLLYITNFPSSQSKVSNLLQSAGWPEEDSSES